MCSVNIYILKITMSTLLYYNVVHSLCSVDCVLAKTLEIQKRFTPILMNERANC